ncbi:hypothetical protein MJM83_29070, partial [Salmonella enterica subsp. enterica serovar Montevideo]|nr:hypothetical protein [Salmonella enterica subsp. enterica serovar Montevideo]
MANRKRDAGREALAKKGWWRSHRWLVLRRISQFMGTPQPLTWGASLLWNADLLMALGQCNRDKASVREQETRRKEIY